MIRSRFPYGVFAIRSRSGNMSGAVRSAQWTPRTMPCPLPPQPAASPSQAANYGLWVCAWPAFDISGTHWSLTFRVLNQLSLLLVSPKTCMEISMCLPGIKCFWRQKSLPRTLQGAIISARCSSTKPSALLLGDTVSAWKVPVSWLGFKQKHILLFFWEMKCKINTYCSRAEEGKKKNRDLEASFLLAWLAGMLWLYLFIFLLYVCMFVFMSVLEIGSWYSTCWPWIQYVAQGGLDLISSPPESWDSGVYHHARLIFTF